jgi:hypothetical protein
MFPLPASSISSGLAVLVLFAHVLFISWVVFGAFVARPRPILRWLHIASLGWALLTEVLYWPCPLTLLENWLEGRAGIKPYQGGFVLHYLDKLVYPDLPNWTLTSAAVVVCTLNFAYYGRQFWIGHRSKTTFEVVRDEQR